jgi:hypothetical protein
MLQSSILSMNTLRNDSLFPFLWSSVLQIDDLHVSPSHVSAFRSAAEIPSLYLTTLPVKSSYPKATYPPQNMHIVYDAFRMSDYRTVNADTDE